MNRAFGTCVDEKEAGEVLEQGVERGRDGEGEDKGRRMGRGRR